MLIITRLRLKHKILYFYFSSFAPFFIKPTFYLCFALKALTDHGALLCFLFFLLITLYSLNRYLMSYDY